MDFCLPELDTTERSEAGVDVPLLTLDNEPLNNFKGAPVILTLLGADSAAYRRAARNQARSVMKRNQANAKANREVSDADLDAADADALAIIVACTTGWRGVIDSKGKPVPFNEQAATAFYRQFPPAREQADRAIVDRARFTKPSLEGSSSLDAGTSSGAAQLETAPV